MNEQQRIFVTVGLCTSIWLGWQVMYGPPMRPDQQTEQQQTAVAAANDARGATQVEATTGKAAGQPISQSIRIPAEHIAAEQRNFTTSLYVGSLQNNDGSFSRLELPAFAARADETTAGASMVSAHVGRQAALDIRANGVVMPLRFVEPGQNSAAGTLAFEADGDAGLQAHIEISPSTEHYVWHYRIRLHNHGQQAVAPAMGIALALSPDEEDHTAAAKAGFFSFLPAAERPDIAQGLLYEGGALDRKKVADLIKSSRNSSKPLGWAGIEQQYFLTAWLPDEAQSPSTASLRADGSVVHMRGDYTLSPLASGQTHELSFRVFAGPKRDTELGAVDERLRDSIDYNFLGIPLGFLARPMMAMLRLFHHWTASWGLAIMLLTLVVKTLLLPVAIKSVVSMKRMQALKPELDLIKERYKSDPEKQQAEQMQLFRDRKVNPVSGCLPMLLQLPVWLTLYRSLWSAVDLYQQPFLWVSDLTAREPFPFLALAVGIITVLQQRLTPMAMDNQQARMMAWIMPGIVTLFMINMPAGLVLYILVNSVLTIVQQLVITKRAAA